VGQIMEASVPTIRLDATPSGPSISPPPTPPQFYAGCPSCRNPSSLSWLGTGTKYAGLHTWRLNSNSNLLQCSQLFMIYSIAQIFWKSMLNSFSYTAIRQTTDTHLTALCPGLPGWSGTRKIKTHLDLLKRETQDVSGSIWTIGKQTIKHVVV